MFGFRLDAKDKDVGVNCEISLTNIFVLNHNKAKQQALKVLTSGNPRLSNSALSEDGTALTSAGHHIVSIVVDKPADAKDVQKATAGVKNALKAYASQWGAATLDDSKIYSLDDDTGSDENNDGKEGTGELSESMLLERELSKKEKALLQQEIEAKISSGTWKPEDIRFHWDDLKAIKGFSTLGKKQIKAGVLEKWPDAFKDGDWEEAKNGSEAPSSGKLGFYFTYEFKVAGLKETSLGSALKKVGAYLLDGLGVKFTSLFGGGGEEITGKDIRKSFNSMFRGINPTQLVNRFESNMKKKIPTGGECYVEIYDKSTIFRKTKQYLDSQAKKKVLDADYSIAIKVNEHDGRKTITPQIIADVLTSSIVGVFKKFKNKLTKNDVILINNSKNRGREAASSDGDSDSSGDVFESCGSSMWLSYPRITLPAVDAGVELFDLLFEASASTSSSSLLSVDFKYPANPSQPEGDKKSFKKDGKPIVIQVKRGKRLSDKGKDKDIPTAQAKQQFANGKYDFIGWNPSLKGDPAISKDTTFVAQYRKQKDAEDFDAAGVDYDYYLVPMPGLKYDDEDNDY